MRSCLAYLGLVITFLMLGLLGWMVLIYTGYDLPSLELPQVSVTWPTQTVQISVATGEAHIEQKSLIDQLPVPTLPPAPSATATPVPDPVVYRSEVMLRAHRFGAALDSLNQMNSELGQNSSLMNDSAWQKELEATLTELAASAQDLGAVTPVPPEYQPIQDWLEKVGPEAQQLQQNYWQGVQTGDIQAFKAAGDNLNNIRNDMLQAQAETAKAGWPQ